MPWPLAQYPQRGISIPRTAGLPTTVTVTTGGTANVKTAWVSVLDPVPTPGASIALVRIAGNSVTATDTAALLDLGIGPAGGGTEQVLIDNLQVGFRPTDSASIMIPVDIPAGCRLSARMSTSRISIASSIGIDLYGGFGWELMRSPQEWTTYGAMTASAGPNLPSNATANVKGAWVQLDAAIAHRIDLMTVTLQGEDATMLLSDGVVDIGVGGAGAETVIAADIPFNQTAAEIFTPRFVGLVPLNTSIPAGTRLAARSAHTNGGQGVRCAVHAGTY